MNTRWIFVFAVSLAAFGGDWNRQRAAEYLDARQKEWFAWKKAGTAGGPCISCHTGIPYLLARAALRRATGEQAGTPYENALVDGVRTRLGTKQTMFFTAAGKPLFTKEPLASQSSGVDAVIGAFVLALKWQTDPAISEDARRAFDRMWSLQIREGPARGSWPWFAINLDPWEKEDSVFYGAALAAAAVGAAPRAYREEPGTKDRVRELVDYLKRERDGQPLHNRLMLLWAASTLPEILPKTARKYLVAGIWRAQQEDGGWTMESLGPWKASPAAPPSSGSNAYATALAVFALQSVQGGAEAPRGLKPALQWLKANQDPESGSWAATSMNKVYPADSMEVRFMRDAATAFATIALARAE